PAGDRLPDVRRACRHHARRRAGPVGAHRHARPNFGLMPMLTVQPCTMIGAYGLEPDRVPRDEFQIRLRTLYGIMDAKGAKAMLVYGDAREHSDLAYFTNF